MSVSPKQNLFGVLAPEIAISTAINGIIPPAIIWALNVPAPATLFGDEPIVRALLPATILPIFLMTIILTLIVRARVSKGAIPALETAGGLAWVRLSTRMVILRALIFSIIGVLILIPLGVAAAQASDVLPLTRNSFAVFNVLYGAVIGVAVTPLVVLAAMTDRKKSPS